MKFNWKIVLAVVILVGAVVWGMQSLQVRTFTGIDLNFGIGSGPVTVTNQTDVPIPVQLVSTGTRSFSITNSSLLDVSGSSVRQGSGSTATQLMEFDLPSGVSEFTIARGNDVTFAARSDKPMQATVQPLGAQNSQTTLLMTIVLVLGSIAYIGYTTKPIWLSRIRKADMSTQDTKPTASTQSGGQGANIRSFGDNRANTGD
jgi:hypothetical protein